ncbi:MAG: MoaD/ThiS family protein [Mycobacterium sp.]
MAEVNAPPEPVEVTVRFFAAARAAAGADSDRLLLTLGATVADVVSELCCRSDELARVLRRCSYLCDGVAVRDQARTLRSGQIVDVLPPFAGG